MINPITIIIKKYKVILILFCLVLLTFTTYTQHVLHINKITIDYLHELKSGSTLVLIDTSITKNLDIKRVQPETEKIQKGLKFSICFYNGGNFLSSNIDDITPYIYDTTIINKFHNYLSVNVFYSGQKYLLFSRYTLVIVGLDKKEVLPDPRGNLETKTYYILLPIGRIIKM